MRNSKSTLALAAFAIFWALGFCSLAVQKWTTPATFTRFSFLKKDVDTEFQLCLKFHEDGVGAEFDATLSGHTFLSPELRQPYVRQKGTLISVDFSEKHHQFRKLLDIESTEMRPTRHVCLYEVSFQQTEIRFCGFPTEDHRIFVESIIRDPVVERIYHDLKYSTDWVEQVDRNARAVTDSIRRKRAAAGRNE